MNALRKHRCFGLVSRWLAVIATLLPLLLPAMPSDAGAIVAQVSVSADVFTAELCSLSRAAHSQGNGQLPADHHDQHCPLCGSIQQLGSCLAAESPVASIAIGINVDVPLPQPVVAHTPGLHSSSQPRAPPVRV